MSRVLTAGALLLLLAGRVWSADGLSELERVVHAAVRSRDQARQEQSAKRTEAVALADEIASLKAGTGGVRAGGVLEQRLRAFDRVAAALDALDRRIETADAAVRRAQREFAAAADAEAERLGRTASSDARARQAVLDEVRDRVRAATDVSDFRPPLAVHRAPEDGPAEIEGKLQLLDAERRRIAEELGRLEAEDRVWGERMAGKRRQAQTLGAARTVGSLPLLDVEAEEIQRALVRLSRQREELARALGRRREALHAVDVMAQELSPR
jgi:hypothetical protein